jgi:ubiquinone/menaquinone biosynthesis C-methylase UbiE
MQTISPDLAQLKSGLKAIWTAGDFGQIGKYTAAEAQRFVERLNIKPGDVVLDVACGTGNTAIPAARAGAQVTGLDLAPNLLAQARYRAVAERVEVRFEEGDAEELPYPGHAFDVVLSMYGAMFAPRPERVASELARVCKRGGLIAMANWTPEGFVGQSFQLTAKMVPPPPNVPPPALWGDETTLRRRLSPYISELKMTRQKARFLYPFGPKEMVAFFRQYFGPTQAAFARLDSAGQASLAEQMESLWAEHNRATDGTIDVEAEYLEVHAIRA